MTLLLFSRFQKVIYSPLQSKNSLLNRITKPLVAKTTVRVPVLLYHYVEIVKDKNDTIRHSLNLTPQTLESQITTLQSAGYHFITASDLANVLDSKMALPEKPIILTFDDGYNDFYTDVLPILKKYQVHATAYIVPGFLNGPNSITSSQLIEATSSGLVDIGAHTMHHTFLKGRDVATIDNEIRQSKLKLENDYHIKVSTFAYPYGAYDANASSLVKKSGFSLAFATMPGIYIGWNNRFTAPRIRPGARTGQALIKFLSQDSFKSY